MEKQDEQWCILSAVNEWVRFADAKASLTLVVQGSIASVSLPPLFHARSLFFSGSLLLTLLVIAAICSTLTIYYCLKCVIPRLLVRGGKSIVFFGDIATSFESADVYFMMLKKYQDEGGRDGLTKHVAHQIWSNSVVAEKKYKCCHWAATWFSIGVAIDISIMVVVFATGW